MHSKKRTMLESETAFNMQRRASSVSITIHHLSMNHIVNMWNYTQYIPPGATQQHARNFARFQWETQNVELQNQRVFSQQNVRVSEENRNQLVWLCKLEFWILSSCLPNPKRVPPDTHFPKCPLEKVPLRDSHAMLKMKTPPTGMPSLPSEQPHACHEKC